MFSFFKKSKSRNKGSNKDNKQPSAPSETLSPTATATVSTLAQCTTAQDGRCTNRLECAENKHGNDSKSFNQPTNRASKDVTPKLCASVDVNARSNSSNKSASNFFDIMAKGRNRRHYQNNRKNGNNTSGNGKNSGKPEPAQNPLANDNQESEPEICVKSENFPNDVNHKRQREEQEEECQISGSVSADENKSAEERAPTTTDPESNQQDRPNDALLLNDVIGKCEGENSIGTPPKVSDDGAVCEIASFAKNTVNGDDVGVSTADFVKELVFQKYKNPQHQTPLYIQTEQLSPQQAVVVENQNFVDSNLDEQLVATMGQPPSKSSTSHPQPHRQAHNSPPRNSASPPVVAQPIPIQLAPASPPPPAPSPTHSKKSVTFATPLEDSIFIPSLRDHESTPDDDYYEADEGPDDTDDNSDIEELASDDDEDEDEEEEEDEEDTSEPSEIPRLDKCGNFETAAGLVPNDGIGHPQQQHIVSNFPIGEETSLPTNHHSNNATNSNEFKRLCLRNDVKISEENDENHQNNNNNKLVISSSSSGNNNNKNSVSDNGDNVEENSQTCDNAFILKHSHTTNSASLEDANGILARTPKVNLSDNNNDNDSKIQNDGDTSSLVARKSAYTSELDTVSLPDVVESNSILLVNAADATTKMISVSEEKMYGTDKLRHHEMRELVNQESRFAAKIEAAETKALEAQNKADELHCKIEVLDKDLADKSWSVERLTGEWEAAIKEGDCMRRKLDKQKQEMETIKQKGYESEEELKQKIEDLTFQNQSLEAKLNAMQTVITSLQDKIIVLNQETEELRAEKERLEDERKLEQKTIQDALEIAVTEREQLEAKWKHEFEELRNHHTDREEHLMEDCEWQLRTMQKQCKDKLEVSEKERKAAQHQVEVMSDESAKCRNEIVKFKSFEAEVSQLRGITKDQKDSLHMMTRQIEELRIELEAANIRLEIELENVKTIKRKAANDVSEKERQMLHAIETQRNEISCVWERRLFEEMDRLKTELEQIHAEERHSALEKLKEEMMEAAAELTTRFNMREKQLWDEIEALKERLSSKCHELEEAQTSRDRQIVESRMFVDRSQRNHQIELDAAIREREEAIEEIKEEHERYKGEIEESFTKRILQVQEEFSRELTDSTDALKKKHKKELDVQYKNLVAEKEQALNSMEQKYRTKLDAAEEKLNELAAGHKRTLIELEDAHKTERAALESRDLQNSREIDTLHRKCRCLTKLFEEMRMRYERRDPRPEDLNQIQELKSIVEAQDRDLRILTERLRDYQINQESDGVHQPPPRKLKGRGKAQPPPQLDLQRITLPPPSQQQPPVQPRHVPQSPTKSPGLKPNIEVIFEENENDADVNGNGKDVQNGREVIATDF